MSNGGVRVSWITNLAAPYRLPVWERLSGEVTLRVLLLENTARLTKDVRSNRGSDWTPDAAGLHLAEWRTLRVKHGEARYYLAVDPLKLVSLGRDDAVVLGGWESPAYWQALGVAKACGVATIGFYESTLATQGFSEGPVAEARSWFFRSLDRVVVPGPAARDALLAMGVDADAVVVGFNAVDVKAFGRVRTTPGSGDGHRFVYVGQLIERKRVDAILRAFAAMRRDHDTLHVIGRGDQSDALHQLAQELGLDQQVTWSAYIPNAELPDVLAEADTLVLASDEEVWGLVVNEALAAGLQVVVTRNCGVVPSVEGMRGVHVVDSASELESGMLASVEHYAGRISDPEILVHTPERFAETFLRAIEEAMSLQAGHRGWLATAQRRIPPRASRSSASGSTTTRAARTSGDRDE